LIKHKIKIKPVKKALTKKYLCERMLQVDITTCMPLHNKRCKGCFLTVACRGIKKEKKYTTILNIEVKDLHIPYPGIKLLEKKK